MHMTSVQYASLLMTASFQDFAIYGSELLTNSHSSKKIIAGTSPLQTKGWGKDASTKPPLITFDRPIYRELAFVIKRAEVDLTPMIDAALPQRHLLFKAARAFAPLPD